MDEQDRRREMERARSGYGGVLPPLMGHTEVLAEQDLGIGPGPSRSPDRSEVGGRYPFAAPALVLLATLAVYEGYAWLHLIPNGMLRPGPLLFALGAAPATFVLTRYVEEQRWLRTGLVARCSATVMPALGIIVAIGHSPLLSRALGVTSLVLAASLLCLVLASESHRYPARSD